jgi:hypothetical protein
MLHNIKNFSGGGRRVSEWKKLCETLAQQTGDDKKVKQKSNARKDNEKLFSGETYNVRGCFLRTGLLSDKQFQFPNADSKRAKHFGLSFVKLNSYPKSLAPLKSIERHINEIIHQVFD